MIDWLIDWLIIIITGHVIVSAGDDNLRQAASVRLSATITVSIIHNAERKTKSAH